MKRSGMALVEIGLALLTGIGKIIFMDRLNWRLPYISVVIIGWLSYILWQRKRNPDQLVRWGFQRDHFWGVAKRVAWFGVLAVAIFMVIGFIQNSLQWTWHLFPILLIYPLWGVFQQFMVISLVVGNWQDMNQTGKRSAPILLLAATLFALVHYPHGWLMGGTFVLALFYGAIFLKERNIYVLGILHGWLGAVFFYTVLGRDPFQEVFGKYFTE